MSSSSVSSTAFQATPVPSKVLNVSEEEYIDDTKASFPKHLIDSLVHKWLKLFNSLLKKNKDVRILSACLDTATFTNCHDVKFNPTHFTYDRVRREFELHVTPMYHQDVLCFRAMKNRRGLSIRVKSVKLRTLFIKFFEQINKIRFCAGCGNFAHATHYYAGNGTDMCETCLFEEICASQKNEMQTCAICQEEGKRMYKTNCGHYFHRKCLAQTNPIPYPRCPLCRKALDPDDEYLDDPHNGHGGDLDEDDWDDDDMDSDMEGAGGLTVARSGTGAAR